MDLGVYILLLCMCASVLNGQQSDRPARCAGIQCSPPNCRDAYLQEGDCCPGCPGPGQSCTYQGRTLRDGERFKQECNTCVCNDGNVACTEMACTGSKAGRCPRPDGIGICYDDCTNDESCPRRQKCCSNGCGRSCQRPIRGKRCRYLGSTYRDGESFRDDCNTCMCYDGNVACTKLACARTCVHNGVTYRDGETYMNECNTCMCSNGQSICTLMACPGRPGTCSEIGRAVGSICIDECTSDYNCPIGEKCCSSGCGQICTKPIDGGGGRTCVHNGVTYKDGETFKDDCNTCVCNNGNAACTLMACPGRPGTCPQIIDAVGSTCTDECTSDYSCPVGQKCCSNGCGRVCTTPVGGGGGKPCIHNGITYKHGESFKDECNTCNCYDGNAACTLMACPGRPGTCPQIIDAVGSTCTDECTSDYSCPVGQKCCSNGCGRVCTAPVGGGGGRPCNHKGKTYQDGESFMDDCNTCNCNDGVAGCTRMACPSRPGTCPQPVGGNAVGICVNECNADGECPYGEKCCSNGCGRVCMKAIGGGGRPCNHKGKTYQDGESFKDDCNTCNCNDGVAGCTRMACPGRPGTCPQPVGGNAVGICVNECNADGECPYGEKCCSNGCGRVCMKAIGGGGRPCNHKGKTYQDGESFKDDCNTCNCNDGVAGCTRMACPDRPGTCPEPRLGSRVGSSIAVCKDECNADRDCSYDEKCCNTGCGRACIKAIGGGADRPGTCPPPVWGFAGNCANACTSDTDCQYGEKCCSNGCGRECMKAEGGGGRPCIHKGKTYQDGESFKDDCNTCNCNDGVAGCTRMACPDRPGTCPEPRLGSRAGSSIDVCIDECNADRDCRYDEKCCNTGCGRACMKAIGGGGQPCIYNGITYKDGVSFKDDCNTCNCNNGQASCTRMECLNRPCVYNGISYNDGETFKDQCNDCTCNDGKAECTMKACPDGKPGKCPPAISSGICVNRCTTDLSCPGREKCCSNGCGTLCLPPTLGGRPCYHNGQTINDGETYKDDCNTCTCSDGKAACTLMACPRKPCMYNGRMYQDGETFKQDCNTCTCNNGQAACTQMACYDEKVGHCPQPNGTGLCIVRCTTDLSCPREQKCCSNGCGTVCKDPVYGGGSCLHNGVLYKDGETFKDDCNTCKCAGGKAGCTRMACPKDKPGTCPAVNNSTMGTCVNECNDDASCPGIQKCCSNGCGQVCMKPDVGTGQPCHVNGYTFQHGESFKDGCNTCMCRNGKPACTKKACPPSLPCYHNGKMYLNGENFTDECNKCICRDGNVACTYKQCGKTCTYKGKTYQDGEAFKEDCNTCQCNDGNVSCTLLDCSGAKPGTCPRPQLFRPCRNRCVNDKACEGTKKCCNNWCGYTCMEPIGRDNCQGIVCQEMVCNLPNTLYTIPGTCCPICRPPLGEKPGSCPRQPRSWLCLDLCTADFHCPGQQKCCSHSCGKSCVRPRFDRCEGIRCPPLRCLIQFRPPGRCCPVCRRRRRDRE